MFTGQSLSPAAGAAAVGDAGSARGFGVLRSDAWGGGVSPGELGHGWGLNPAPLGRRRWPGVAAEG